MIIWIRYNPQKPLNPFGKTSLKVRKSNLRRWFLQWCVKQKIIEKVIQLSVTSDCGHNWHNALIQIITVNLHLDIVIALGLTDWHHDVFKVYHLPWTFQLISQNIIKNILSQENGYGFFKGWRITDWLSSAKILPCSHWEVRECRQSLCLITSFYSRSFEARELRFCTQTPYLNATKCSKGIFKVL